IKETVKNIDNLEDYCVEESKHSFDFNNNLIDIEITKITNSNDLLLNLTHHHILSDAFSVGIIINEIFFFYNAIVSSTYSISPKLLEKEVGYLDYIYFQNYELTTEKYKVCKNKLINKFKNCSPIILNKRKAIFDNKQERISYKLESEVVKRLKKISVEHYVSLYSILLTGIYHIFSTYSMQKTNFPISITVSNRPFELNNSIGPFISIMPFIPQYINKMSLLEQINHSNDELLYLNDHSQLNINLITEESGLHPEIVGDLLHIIFGMHNYKQELDSDRYDFIDIKENGEKSGISIIAEEVQGDICFNVSYSCSLYDKTYISSILSNYINFLKQINHSMLFTSMHLISYMDYSEYRKVTQISNLDDLEINLNANVLNLFDYQVKNNPDCIAIVCEDKNITYLELSKRVSILANYLIDNYNVVIENPVCLLLDRNEYLLISMLAILKAGGAYVPIDTSMPKERIKSILYDSNAQVLLTNLNSQDLDYLKLPHGIKVLNVIELLSKIDKSTIGNFLDIINGHNIAYIIYTSGTMGKPKGIMVSHRSLYNYVCNYKNNIHSKNDIVDFSTSISFDLTITTTICTLCCGARIAIYTNKLQYTIQYKNHLYKNYINLVKLTPSYFELIVDNLHETKLNTVMLGGEKLNFNNITNAFKGSNEVRIFDEYGPTETTVGATLQKVIEGYDYSIGKPYTNYKVYILDNSLNPVPIGATGEIYISGEGLARGYNNNPALTSEKFIANLFSTSEDLQLKKNLRIYKTGDLGMCLNDGTIKYIGRADSQVKIRGYRVELNEIKEVLDTHHDIKSSIITYNENTLVGYILTNDFKPSDTELHEFLTLHLPEYMIPDIYIFIDNIPLNSNGKVDYNKLPDHRLFGQKIFISPRNSYEEKICVIWSDLLNIDYKNLGVQDDFFKLGGNSILAIRLAHKLSIEFNHEISISVILENSTLDKLSNYLSTYYHKDEGISYEF
ncbi:MAG: amino acid adenylation domain-containing protein, partial [Alphaproteobacteria bacterium]